MLYPTPSLRPAPLLGDGPAGLDPAATARHSLGRLRHLLRSFTPPESGGVREGALRLRGSLATFLDRPGEEAERLFFLGWLRWLGGEGASGIPLFEACAGQAEALDDRELLAESAYWQARVALPYRPDALAGYETTLRKVGGLPRATAWFVDLLWRAGQVARAEQVWKVARGRCLASCPEGPLIEARILLQRGELPPAERLLRDSLPSNGVVWVERGLLLTWVTVAQRQRERGRELFDEAGRGPYPAGALERWRRVLHLRTARAAVPLDAPSASPLLADFLRGQQARLQGDLARAAEAYRAALSSAPARPFARYALACLGEDDFADLLSAHPGLFLAVRCRARLAGERFLRRAAPPGEFLDTDRHAAAAGYHNPAAEPLRRLAQTLQNAHRPGATDEDLTATLDGLLEAPGPESQAEWRNQFRAALELAVRHLPARAALGHFLLWADLERLADEPEMRRLLARQILRCLLLGEERSEKGRTDAVLAAAERLCPDEPALALMRSLREDSPGPPGETSVPSRVWQAARALHARLAGGPAEIDAWRAEVAGLREGHWRGAAQVLLLLEAAGRQDVAEAARLLAEVDHWRGLRPGPPRSLLRLLEHLVVAHPHHPGLKAALGRWLGLWDPAALGPPGATLAGILGIAVPEGDVAPPAGVPERAWWLYQTARALGREDAVAALAALRRAAEADPSSLAEALAELERRAAGQRLLALEEGPPRDGGLLADAVDLLREHEQGRAVLEALGRGDAPEALSRIGALADLPDLSPRLAHHLALVEQRRALALEEREETEAAVACWRVAWGFWLRFLAGKGEEVRTALVDWLLARHRGRLNDLLARNAVGRSRALWDLVRELPARSAAVPGLGELLADRAGRFRDQLATEYLVSTREAMRYGDIPEGWRADYEKGLMHLRRMLSIDRDNVRLLTALAEVCGEWFLDLYNCSDGPGLRRQVERFTPFALQLARLAEDRPGELPARAALSEFYKFRGFVADDPADRAALYREALRFNPANENARDLLAGLEGEEGDDPDVDEEDP